jgi:hypothetical protein
MWKCGNRRDTPARLKLPSLVIIFTWQGRSIDMVIEYEAQLVWMKVKEGGKMESALKYNKAKIVL